MFEVSTILKDDSAKLVSGGENGFILSNTTTSLFCGISTFVELIGGDVVSLFGEVLKDGASLSMEVDEGAPAVSLGGRVAVEMELKEKLTAVRIKNDSLRDENVSIKKHYQGLYQSKAESNSNVSSGAAVPEKPKVLAPGLYAMTPKNLPARSENVKRVDNPLRNLNKRNRVNSSLKVKRTGFILKSVYVCKTCNECLVFGNHDKCGVKNLNYGNAKNLKVKNDANVKQVWKATGKIFASVGSKWKPTGRKFTLGDTCPLTRITKPEVLPLEKSGSISTSEPANNVTVTPRFSKRPLTSCKRKDRKLKDIFTSSPANAETKAVNDHVNVNDLSANQLDPNKNWVFNVPNSTASSVSNACRTDCPLVFGLRLYGSFDSCRSLSLN
nr:hypothetical protein [Tanacetum cinerariifolium]